MSFIKGIAMEYVDRISFCHLLLTNSSDGQMVKASAPEAVNLVLIPSRVEPFRVGSKSYSKFSISLIHCIC